MVNALTAVIVVIVVAGVLSVAISAFNITGNIASAPGTCSQAPYTVEECTTVNYTDFELFSERECRTVPYTDNVCESRPLLYHLSDANCTQRVSAPIEAESEPARAECTATNLDSLPGIVSVRIGFYANMPPIETNQTSVVYPQSSQTFVYTYDGVIDDCFCELRSATKQECREATLLRKDCRNISRHHPVTKTRQECSAVVKYREVCG